ncbi:mitochondrial ribosomal subunit protein-domain-containing protein [Xylariales sp. PMI_506]|nr:mitochondrial ribosomal subunit protein-domain-containing protein [Xylariales sp. PMI_506]
MASAVQSFRLCVRAGRNATAPRRIAPHVFHPRRALSNTPTWRKEPTTDAENPAQDVAASPSKPSETPLKTQTPRRSDKVVLQLQEGLDAKDKEKFQNILAYADAKNLTGKADQYLAMPSKELQAAVDKGVASLDEDSEKMWREMEAEFKDLDMATHALNKPVKANKKSFWSAEEEDPELITEELDDDDLGDDDIMTMAHGKLEEHREYREYARIAAWQMPLLSKLARPFEPPTAQECLRFRYTTYMGENHPAQSKVVVEFCTKDLPLTGAQATKLKKLVGTRWNPDTNIIKMSCEQFEHQAQNKRYLSDLVQKLIKEAQNPTDMFEDVPLDTRHHQRKSKPTFPAAWKMTPKRVKELEDTREKSLLLDQARQEAGSLVDGTKIVDMHFQPTLTPLATPVTIARKPIRQLPRQKRV